MFYKLLLCNTLTMFHLKEMSTDVLTDDLMDPSFGRAYSARKLSYANT